MIVVWRVTQQCNLACQFCGYDRTLAWPRNEADPAVIRRFGTVLAAYQQKTGDRVLVSWLGGEPLRWPPLAELSGHFHHDLDLRVSTTTNGTTLAASAVRQHLIETHAELTVSVDGSNEFHDDVRGWPGGFAALRTSVTALAAEKRALGGGPLLRANVVLMRDNLAGFPRLCEELAGWGIEQISFNQLGGNDRPEFFPAQRLLPGQVRWLAAEMPALRTRLCTQGVQLLGGPGYLRRIAATAADERLPVADCHPGERFLFINEAGSVAPCSFTVRECGVPLTELVSAEDVQRLPLRFAAARLSRNPLACGDCHSTQVFEKFSH